MVCYPFLYSAAPGTGYWIDGRYGIYFPALVVALLATMPLQQLWPQRSRHRGAVRCGGHAGLGRAGLGHAGLGHAGLGHASLGHAGLGHAGVG